jgi:Protein of unknown function (DUF2516)
VAGEIFGLSGVIILLVFLALPIWALVDAISRPGAAFAAARSSKGMWIALIVVFSLLTGIVGVVLSVIYLASIRPRVKAATV